MSASVATAPAPQRVPARRAGFGGTVASEITKLVSLRSSWIMLVLAVLIGVGMTVVITASIAAAFDSAGPQVTGGTSAVSLTLVGTLFSTVVLVVMGSSSFAAEYSTGSIRPSLLATPRRGQLLSAKILVVGVTIVLTGLVASFLSFWVGQAILGTTDLPLTGLGDGETLRTVLLNGVSTVAYPMIALALAVMLRNGAGAITATLALLFIPSFFGGLLSQWWQENVLARLPGPAVNGFAGLNDPSSATSMEFWPATLQMAIWIVAPLLLAWVVLRSRDAG